MKKLLVIIIVLLTSSNSFGQWVFGRNPIINKPDWDKQRVHWGYYLGFNSYDFKFDYDKNFYDKLQEYEEKQGTPSDYTEIQVTSNIGFNVGLVGNLRIMEYIDLRFEPGLYYTKRELRYPSAIINEYFHSQGIANPSTNELNNTSLKSVSSTYIHFPLLLKFSSKRIGNIKPYVLGGASLDLNLSSNHKVDSDNFEGVWRMKNWTANYELGVGIDIYFEYFKFSPSIRGVFGIGDELKRDNKNSPWTGDITSMKTRGLFVNFTFH
ncbi:porin family protein [Myroides phaeus]|uniref:type IX secretion/gliding motility protein PorT/SprT n=1 Tax=Myroides phaeus TaxID=702745 RepID=UPI002DB84A8A|nr:porin family protein [Myroides phaeus]MEC4116765.1 porin family protein [Myroides phaeus]